MVTERVKSFVVRSKVLSFLVKPIYVTLTKKSNFSSGKYWNKRYAKGGNSGGGSYGKFAEFKAEVINDFVQKNKVASAIEFGCGDGNQLSLLKIPQYTGFDVAKKSVEMCQKRFASDSTKSFFLYDPQYFYDRSNTFKADLTLSLDVIYHLVEDNVFEKYMHDLFSSSKQYVIIYSANTDENDKYESQHVRLRKFSNWIEKNAPKWKLTQIIKNKYPLLAGNSVDGTFADFYFYEKTE